jgi:hypothetical protein
MSQSSRPPRQVLIHAGHGKTGSSFLQSALANSVAVLDAHGIAYPLDPAEVERVRAGGNLAPSPAHFSKLIEQRWSGSAERLLISGESYFYKLRPTGFFDNLRNLLPDAEVRVLLYVRDPLDHAVSKYQKAVKRGGYTGDFEAALGEYNIPGNVGNFLNWIENTMGVPVTVINYSRHRDTLMSTMEQWLDVPQGTLISPAQGKVNRSLTNSETELQRLFNGHFGVASAEFVTDPLCALLPHVPSERPPVGPEALGAFLVAMKKMIAKHGLDARFGVDEAYHVPTLDEVAARFAAPDPATMFQFSGEQLRVFVEAFCKEIDLTAVGEGVATRVAKRAARKAAEKDRMQESIERVERIEALSGKREANRAERQAKRAARNL